MSVYSLARDFLILAIASILSCCYPPNTSIEARFVKPGEIEYKLLGTDDGEVVGISASFNNGDWQYFIPEGESVKERESGVGIPIIPGENTAMAIAEDDQGLKDDSPAEYSFFSLSEEDARKAIENIFSEKNIRDEMLESGEVGATFRRDEVLAIGELEEVRVDYLINAKNKDAVVAYIGHGENLEQAVLDKALLGEYGIVNLYLFRVPESEIKSGLEKFVSENIN